MYMKYRERTRMVVASKKRMMLPIKVRYFLGTSSHT